MIKNIKELKAYLLSKAKDFDGDEIFTKRYALFKSGIPNIQKEALILELQNIPNSYISCLLSYNVFQVCVGYFSISPISYDVENIVDSLIMAQDPEDSFLPRAILDPLDLYWIGNNNDYTIYVAGKISPKYKEGEIVSIHEFILGSDPQDYDNYMMLLAKDFEQFLIIAGNLNEIHRENIEDFEDRKAEMKRRLEILGVDEKYFEAWYAYL